MALTGLATSLQVRAPPQSLYTSARHANERSCQRCNTACCYKAMACRPAVSGPACSECLAHALLPDRAHPRLQAGSCRLSGSLCAGQQCSQVSSPKRGVARGDYTVRWHKSGIERSLPQPCLLPGLSLKQASPGQARRQQQPAPHAGAESCTPSTGAAGASSPYLVGNCGGVQGCSGPGNL